MVIYILVKAIPMQKLESLNIGYFNISNLKQFLNPTSSENTSIDNHIMHCSQ